MTNGHSHNQVCGMLSREGVISVLRTLQKPGT
jgi:hypothetical protein